MQVLGGMLDVILRDTKTLRGRRMRKLGVDMVQYTPTMRSEH
jgi:hypothetical protein